MEWIIDRYNWGELKGKISNHRRISDLMMVLFFILLYIFLKTSEIPPLNVQFTRTYKEIDITKIAPERVKLIKKHEIPMPNVSNEDGRLAQAERTEIADVDLLTQDVTSVINQQPPRSIQTVPEWTKTRHFEAPTIHDDLTSIQLQQSKDILRDNATQLLPNIRVEPTQVGPTVAINENPIHQEATSKRPRIQNPDGPAIPQDKPVAESGPLNIPLISRDQAKSRTDLSVIIDDLMEWMKKHPSQFIPVVKSFMMYEVGDLTSRVTFSHKDRRFELYLLYKPNRREIRVCLIEGNQSSMLIDSGFKKQSNYLRTGAISRTRDREIFAFSTSQFPANEEKTMEFYQVFLTWWDQAKLNK